MPATTEPTARYRRSRTRSRNINARPALAVSSLKPYQYDLHPSCTSLICPDCKTWVPITGLNAKKQKLVPHDTGVARKDAAVRCQGSNRLVNIDVLVRAWQGRMEVGGPEANGRRSARQHHKPLPAPDAPVSRITGEVTLESARQSYLAHRKGCTQCVGGQHCTDGGILARRYVLALNQEPTRREAREQMERQERRTVRKQTAPAVRKAQWAKHGGKAVETANNLCSERTPGSLSEFCGPQLPLEPQDVKAHDRRQAELGKRYARKNPATSAA